MSLVQTAERLALKYLPPRVTTKLQELKQRLPLRLVQAHPIVQMYINDEFTRSFVGMHNFYSALMSDVESPASARLRFYSPNGKLVAKHSVSIPHFAARAVDVKQILDGSFTQAPYGVVTVQITPWFTRRRAYREFGQFSAHFFMFFRDRTRGSVEQTHPLSTADPNSVPCDAFVSSQVISTAKLEQLVAYQYNPTARSHTLEHALVDLATGEKVATSSMTLPPMGSGRSTFVMKDLGQVPTMLSFCVDALPSGNAKPMLRRVFASGHHSMSHA
ncbi:MAG: hypothetical protein ACKV2T_39535 [Kofleriaceae bacterium]